MTSTLELSNLKKSLVKLKQQKLKRLARHSAFAFAQYVAPAEYQWGWHHAILYRYLDAFARKQIPLLIIEMPPGHGKSEGLSRNLPAYIHGRDPDARIIGTSYTQDLAAEMNRDVQRCIDGEKYRELFPNTRLGGSNVRALAGLPRRNADIFDVAGHRGYYKAAGIGVGITGRRFDYGLIDDPVKDRETANSPTMREAQWRWYNSVFRTRRARNAVIGIVGTRWHEDDLIGRIKSKAAENPRAPQPVVLTLPAIATDDRHPEDPRKPGEALWPWFKSLADLEQEQESDPLDFSALYQQNPRGEGAVEWDGALFPPSIWFDDWPNDLILRVIALDPSKGKDAKHGDYSAFAIVSISKDGSTIWVEGDLARRGTTQIVADGFGLAERFTRETSGILDGFGVEANAFQELLADDFIRYSKAAGFMLPIYKINNSVNKIVRIRRLTPHLTAKNIRFRATPGTRLLIQQMKGFPVGSHDDGPDALEMAIRLAWELWKGKRGK